MKIEIVKANNGYCTIFNHRGEHLFSQVGYVIPVIEKVSTFRTICPASIDAKGEWTIHINKPKMYTHTDGDNVTPQFLAQGIADFINEDIDYELKEVSDDKV